jgi:hypothetical protein
LAWQVRVLLSTAETRRLGLYVWKKDVKKSGQTLFRIPFPKKFKK